jgi:hypothetical protein
MRRPGLLTIFRSRSKNENGELGFGAGRIRDCLIIPEFDDGLGHGFEKGFGRHLDLVETVLVFVAHAAARH